MANKHIQSYINRAHQQRLQGNSRAAADTLRRALPLAPEHAFLYAFLARCLLDELYDKDDHALFVESREFANNALNIEADNAYAHYVLASLYIHEGGAHLVPAENHIKTALDIDPKNPDYILALGHLYESQGKKKLALETYEKALSLDPQNIVALLYLSEFYYNNKRDINRAEALCIEALRISPEQPQVHNILGNIAFQKGNVEAAKEHISIALAHNPNDFATLMLVAALETYNNIFLRKFFYFSRRLLRKNLWFPFMIIIMLIVAELASHLPEQIYILKRDWIYACIAVLSLYGIYAPYLFIQKIKKKYMAEQKLSSSY